MKARPILFSGPMVRALLEGRKTQTRREIKPQPGGSPISAHKAERPWLGDDGKWRWMHGVVCREDTARECPYGKPGDLLWVRESFKELGRWERHEDQCGERYTQWVGTGLRHPMADGPEPKPDADHLKWRSFPSIHMPKCLSRLTLEITDIRVERLQEISEADIYAEGAITEEWLEWREDVQCIGMPSGSRIENERDKWEQLWSTVNGPESWAANPWVWVVEFKVHKRNVDQLLKQQEAA